ncbi:MAG: ABC transporter ATP-binding protein [Candidatus Dormibacteria bacterium]
MVSPLIELERVTKVYGSGDGAVVALGGVTFSVQPGEFVAIMGPSGSGKSTLMNILGCLDSPTRGTFRFAGEDVSRLDERHLAHVRNRRIGFVFQRFHLLPRINAQQNVELPLLYRGGVGRREAAQRALAQVGLTARARHRPSEMSGGQQQRVAIARALVTDPDLILADEPTGNLDSASSAEVLEVLSELNRSGRTVLMITHEPDVAAAAHRIIHVRDGLVTSEERAA